MNKDKVVQPIDVVGDIRKQVENLGGTVGEILPVARWIQLNGVFTPEQLRSLAKAVEKSWNNRAH
jgi:hypothetical protein